MATAATVRTPRLQKTPRGSNLSRELAARDAAVARLGYTVLGRLRTASTPDGRILEFPPYAPMIVVARLESGPLVLLGQGANEWTGAPKLRTTDATHPCLACATKCDECAGKGTRPCTHTGCGGRGYVVVMQQQVDVVKGKQVIIPAQTVECPSCHGSKVEKCRLCVGTGKMSTGRAGGSTRENDPRCQTCQGLMRSIQWRAQELPLHGTLNGYQVVGPFAQLLYVGIASGDTPAGTIRILPDREGNYAVLLVAGKKAWLYGGAVVSTS